MARVIKGDDESDSTHFSSEYKKLINEFKKSKLYKMVELYNLGQIITSYTDIDDDNMKKDRMKKMLLDNNCIVCRKLNCYFIFKKYDEYGFGLFIIYIDKRFVQFFNGGNVESVKALLQFLNDNEISHREHVKNLLKYNESTYFIEDIKWRMRLPGFISDYTIKTITPTFAFFGLYNLLQNQLGNFEMLYNGQMDNFVVKHIYSDKYKISGQYNGCLTVTNDYIFEHDTLIKEVDFYQKSSVDYLYTGLYKKYNSELNVPKITIDKINICNSVIICNYDIISSEINIIEKNGFLLIDREPNCKNIKSDVEIELESEGFTWKLYCNKDFYNSYKSWFKDNKLSDTEIIKNLKGL